MKKTKSQKKREMEDLEAHNALPPLPDDGCCDVEGVLHHSDGSYVDNGLCRTSDDGELLSEGNPGQRLLLD